MPVGLGGKAADKYRFRGDAMQGALGSYGYKREGYAPPEGWVPIMGVNPYSGKREILGYRNPAFDRQTSGLTGQALRKAIRENEQRFGPPPRQGGDSGFFKQAATDVFESGITQEIADPFGQVSDIRTELGETFDPLIPETGPLASYVDRTLTGLAGGMQGTPLGIQNQDFQEGGLTQVQQGGVQHAANALLGYLALGGGAGAGAGEFAAAEAAPASGVTTTALPATATGTPVAIGAGEAAATTAPAAAAPAATAGGASALDYARVAAPIVGALAGSALGGDQSPATQQQSTKRGASPLLTGTDPISIAVREALMGQLTAADLGSNPYFAQYLEAALRPTRQYFGETVMPNIAGEAIQTGGYGGSRQGVAEGLASGRLAQSEHDTASKLAEAFYSQGLAAERAGIGLAEGLSKRKGSSTNYFFGPEQNPILGAITGVSTGIGILGQMERVGFIGEEGVLGDTTGAFSLGFLGLMGALGANG